MSEPIARKWSCPTVEAFSFDQQTTSSGHVSWPCYRNDSKRLEVSSTAEFWSKLTRPCWKLYSLDYRYWVFTAIMGHFVHSFSQQVSAGNFENLEASAKEWVGYNLTLHNLRKGTADIFELSFWLWWVVTDTGLSSLCFSDAYRKLAKISAKTSIVEDPSKLPEEAMGFVSCRNGPVLSAIRSSTYGKNQQHHQSPQASSNRLPKEWILHANRDWKYKDRRNVGFYCMHRWYNDISAKCFCLSAPSVCPTYFILQIVNYFVLYTYFYCFYL